MRLLHTSDWHLGRSLHGHSLINAQGTAVAEMVDAAIDRDVDLFIVAGDVFDRAVPPVEALRILNDAVARLDAAGIQVVLIAGNHDSGERLSLYADVLREGVRIVGDPHELTMPVVCGDEHGEVLVYSLPFLDPDFARVELAEDPGEPLARSHDAVMTQALALIDRDRMSRGNPRSIAIAHAFVIASEPAEVSESERDIAVGGVESVPVARFGAGFDYVALGHLHRPQQVGGASVRYSGSLLRYSLSEAAHEKSFLIVDIGAPGIEPVIEQVRIDQPRPMSRLRGSMAELLSDDHAHERDHFVELVVVEEAFPERMHAQLDAVFPFALRKEFESTRVASVSAPRGDARGRDPLEVVREFLLAAGVEVDDDRDLALVREVHERVRGLG